MHEINVLPPGLNNIVSVDTIMPLDPSNTVFARVHICTATCFLSLSSSALSLSLSPRVIMAKQIIKRAKRERTGARYVGRLTMEHT